jgi:hypothetical protein
MTLHAAKAKKKQAAKLWFEIGTSGGDVRRAERSGGMLSSVAQPRDFFSLPVRVYCVR